MNITTAGLDLAKNVFHVLSLDSHGREVMKKRLTRAQVLKHLANVPRCIIAMMEAWERRRSGYLP